MKIDSLSLTNFRAFKRLEVDFSDHLNLFIGSNAQGKTTILEAINLLSLMTSPLARSDREMVNFQTLTDEIPVGRITAVVEKNQKKHRMELRLILNSVQNGNSRLRKELLIDGVNRRIYDSVGFFNSILFLPQMTRIIEDGPDERRRYIDQALSQVVPGYMRALGNYLKGVSKRNALLKQLNEKGGDQDQLIFWDDFLAENGAKIINWRRQAIAELSELSGSHHLNLTGGKEVLKFVYLPSLPIANDFNDLNKAQVNNNHENEIRQLFLNQLKCIRREEIARGVTTIGPHRDDFQFLVNQIDMGVYGSRGQIRTVVMALKFAEKDWFENKTGELPVILLDETLAELDGNRRKDLLGLLGNGSQAVLTTADLELFNHEFIQLCQVWQVEQGAITKAAI